MKTITITLAMLFSALITGCGESTDRDLSTRTPEEQQAADDLYKGLETPVDRSRSKEY
ncbi:MULTISPECIES: hypothetical protein [Pseudomonadota]|uniref:Lipoprotein n=1 Tax=Achromobacter denitrificans TaxID=32002 RepID=A0A6N0JJ51_ACHDE|nr:MULTISPECIES: hypothetical protein [Pseudomonadota]QKQ47073.1 hypothetical protein FOC81_10355 [Achromobacter denitrificans]QPL36720.1 hypothetical protein IT971_05255 [Thalassospira sp. B30-1]WGQ36972.1 hypothetical protein QEZ63_07505 [Alcaligenes faecalis]